MTVSSCAPTDWWRRRTLDAGRYTQRRRGVESVHLRRPVGEPLLSVWVTVAEDSVQFSGSISVRRSAHVRPFGSVRCFRRTAQAELDCARPTVQSVAGTRLRAARRRQSSRLALRPFSVSNTPAGVSPGGGPGERHRHRRRPRRSRAQTSPRCRGVSCATGRSVRSALPAPPSSLTSATAHCVAHRFHVERRPTVLRHERVPARWP